MINKVDDCLEPKCSSFTTQLVLVISFFKNDLIWGIMISCFLEFFLCSVWICYVKNYNALWFCYAKDVFGSVFDWCNWLWRRSFKLVWNLVKSWSIPVKFENIILNNKFQFFQLSHAEWFLLIMLKLTLKMTLFD